MVSAAKTYVTGIGERRVVILDDGSKISLDAATQVTVHYTKRARQLRLESGRAKFDVAKDASRPFTVGAADKAIRATGTAFSVELLQGAVSVVLYEGHVQVLTDERGSRAEPIKIHEHLDPGLRPGGTRDELVPGRELIVPVKASAAEVSDADPVRSLAWEGGQLVFVGEPLASAVERVNRYSSRQIRRATIGQRGSVSTVCLPPEISTRLSRVSPEFSRSKPTTMDRQSCSAAGHNKYPPTERRFAEIKRLPRTSRRNSNTAAGKMRGDAACRIEQ